MSKHYTKEQAQKALEKLPDELQEAVFSMETADAIWNASEKQSVTTEERARIAEYAGYVLLGLMLPQEFTQALVADIKLSKNTAQEIAREINRFVFYPVKPVLEQLHNMQIAATSKTSASKPIPQETEQPDLPEKSSGPDIYQEPLEEE